MKTHAVSPSLRTDRYPVWSVKTITVVALLVAAVTAFVVYVFGHRSFLVETERVLAVVSGALFSFLAVGLYRGVRVDKGEKVEMAYSPVSMEGWGDGVPDLGSVADVDADSGCVGAIVGVLVSIVLAVLLICALWLLVNIGLAVVVVLVVATGWVFSRALRRVFAHSRTCKGDVGKALLYAAGYTVLYTGWMFVLAYAANYMVATRAG